MKLIEILNRNNIKYREIESWGVYYRKKWKEVFAKDLSQKEQDEIYLEYFLWHLFSYEKKEHLSIDNARNAFDNLKKGEIYIFYQHLDNLLIFEDGNTIKSKIFKNLSSYINADIYIVDKDFSWTYLLTHEEEYGFGPYFLSIEK